MFSFTKEQIIFDISDIKECAKYFKIKSCYAHARKLSKDGDPRGADVTRALATLGGYIIGINHDNKEVFDFFIKVPDVGDLNPVTQIISIRILSYQLAVMRGADPDKPRNLAKSVTVK